MSRCNATNIDIDIDIDRLCGPSVGICSGNEVYLQETVVCRGKHAFG
jgi:hypothetical protein